MEAYIEVLKSKLYRARVTAGSLDYEGSIGISRELCESVGLIEYEKVLIANIENGERWETYVICVEESGQIVLNGAAARKGLKGDRLIIMSFAEMEVKSAPLNKPQIAHLDEENRITRSGGK